MPDEQEQARLRENAKFAKRAEELRKQQAENNKKINKVRRREARRNKK